MEERRVPRFRETKTSTHAKLLLARFQYPASSTSAPPRAAVEEEDLDLPEMTETQTPEEVLAQLSASDMALEDDQGCPEPSILPPPPPPGERSPCDFRFATPQCDVADDWEDYASDDDDDERQRRDDEADDLLESAPAVVHMLRELRSVESAAKEAAMADAPPLPQMPVPERKGDDDEDDLELPEMREVATPEPIADALL